MGWRTRLGYLFGGPEFLVTPLFRWCDERSLQCSTVLLNRMQLYDTAMSEKNCSLTLMWQLQLVEFCPTRTASFLQKSLV